VRHLIWHEPGRLAWETADDPRPGPADAVIRPLAVGRCDLDPIMAANGLFPGPFPVGHEVVGEVIAIGPGVQHHAVGDRVIVPFQVSCGACRACRDSRFAACHMFRAPAGAAFGFGSSGGRHGGAVADRLLVPCADAMLFSASDLDPVRLCLLPDNCIDGYRAVGPALSRYPGGDVLVVGGMAPSVGLYAVAMARALGAGAVRYVDRDSARCAQAEALGADVTQLEGAWPKRFDRALITVENTGEVDGLACVISSTDDYGVCTPVAIHFAPTTPVPMLAMYTKGITLNLGRADSRRYLPEVLRLAKAGRFDPLSVTTNVFPMDAAAEAWLADPTTKLVLQADTEPETG
jgi:threonine dehydrogenase-like Zn-dependent dehydrogenase